MKQSIIMRFLFLLTVVALTACSRRGQDSIPAYEFEQYCLFTWETRSGDFCCAIMIQAESHEFLKSWMPQRSSTCGISALKKALSTLPKDSHVFWQDWPPKFKYPSDRVVAEVIEFATSKNIHLEQSPSAR